jgi:hypothetical protein
MSGTDVEDLAEDTQQAIEALRRLVEEHQALTREEALSAVEALVAGADAEADVDASPADLLDASGEEEEETEASGETESPTA